MGETTLARASDIQEAEVVAFALDRRKQEEMRLDEDKAS
jgi:hypothetical protein